MKRTKTTSSSPRPKRTQLKAATIQTKLVPRGYEPPSMVPHGREKEPNVEHARPKRYTRARYVKAIKLLPQVETVADYGDQKGEHQ